MQSRSRSIFLCSTSLLLLLTGCRSKEDPNVVLRKMHERMATMAENSAKQIVVPEKSHTKAVVRLVISPFEPFLPVSATMDGTVEQLSNLSDPAANQADTVASLRVDADFPPSLLGMAGLAGLVDPVQQGNVKVIAQVQTGIRLLKEQFFLTFAKAHLQIPTLSKSATISPAVAQRWYVATAQELREMMGGTAQSAGTVQAFFKNPLLQGERVRKDMLSFFKGISIWKPAKKMTTKDGLLHIAVESDPEKLQRTLTDLAAMLARISSQGDAEAQKDVEKKIADGFKEIGSIRGTVKATPEYAFAGFDGDLLNEKKEVQLSIATTFHDDTILVKLHHPKKTESVMVFEKKGSAFSVSADGKKVLEGIVSDKQLAFSVLDGGKKTLLGDFVIEEASRKRFSIHGSLADQEGRTKLFVRTLEAKLDNDSKDKFSALQASLVIADQNVAEIAASWEQKEDLSVRIEAPASPKPLNTLLPDLQPFFTAVVSLFQ